MKKTVQLVPKALFSDFSFFNFGKPFIKKINGFNGNSLVQPVKIDGQHLSISLNNDRYVSHFMIIAGDINIERIERKQVIFVAYGGKISGFLGNQVFKNKIYYDAKEKINADQQQTFLHVTSLALQKLDIIDRNRPKTSVNELKIIDVPLLNPIPGKIPKDLHDLLLSI